jgi:uncharacterized protein (UPF0335 family)
MSDGNVAAEQLRLFIERIERLEEEKKGISDDIKDVYLEAKSNGYDVKTMRAIVRLRKLETHVRQESEILLETYKNALGIDSYEPARAPGMFEGHDGRPVPDEPAPPPSASDAELFATALNLIVEHDKASTSWLQRQLRIGYNQAARIIEHLEKKGVVTAPDHLGKRMVTDEAQWLDKALRVDVRAA